MIPTSIKEFFNDIDHPWSWDFKSQKIPKFPQEHQLVRWVMNHSKWPYLPLILPDAPYQDMFKEALAIEDLFVVHRTPSGQAYEAANQGWRSVCLHGEAWNKTEYWAVYAENQGKTEQQVHFQWCDEIVERCPETTRYFKEYFPNHNYQRLRFMWLDPGGYIQPHQDRTQNFLSPINIALNNPPGCVFKMKDKGYVPFKDHGSACLVDIGNVHAVWNNSNTVRIHMISHGQGTDSLTRIVAHSLKILLDDL